MKQDKACDICGGRRYIRLPILRPVSIATSFEATASVEPSSREYPCPECCGFVKEERVAVLDVHSQVSAHIKEPGYINHYRTSCAHRLVDHLLSGGFITFEEGKTDDKQMTFPIIASLGVVAKGTVSSLEERIAARQDQVARAVAEESKKQISNWNSYFGHSEILKRDARAQVDSALNSVLSNWSKARSLNLEN
jgi:uncharacterized small protein (DUF1192 family)